MGLALGTACCCKRIYICFCANDYLSASYSQSKLPFTETGIDISKCDNCITCAGVETGTLSITCNETSPTSTITVTLSIWCDATLVGTDSADIVLPNSDKCTVEETYNIQLIIGGCDFLVVLSDQPISDCGCTSNTDCDGLANSWTDNFDVMPVIAASPVNIIYSSTELIFELEQPTPSIGHSRFVNFDNLICSANSGAELLTLKATCWIENFRANPSFWMTGEASIPGIDIILKSDVGDQELNIIIDPPAAFPITVVDMPINMAQYYAIEITATTIDPTTIDTSDITIKVDGVVKYTGTLRLPIAGTCTVIPFSAIYQEQPKNQNSTIPWAGPDDVFKIKDFSLIVT